LVRGGDGDRVDVESLELLHDQPPRVDRHRDHLQPGMLGRAGLQPPSRILDRDPLCAALAEGEPDVRQTVREAGRDDHVVGVGDRRPDAADIVAHGHSQLLHAPRVAVRQGAVGKLADRAGDRRQQPLARERREVGLTRAQVVGDPGRGVGLSGGRAVVARRGLGDHSVRTATTEQIPLGGELGVGLDHDPA
jgi:hypothetical protein